MAGFSLKAFFGPLGSSTNLGSNRLMTSAGPVEGIALEALGTFILSMSALIASHYVRNPMMQASLVGTTLFLLIMVIGPFTTASFNPVRSLGPSIASGYLDNQYVYWIGPLTGGALAGSVFRVLGS